MARDVVADHLMVAKLQSVEQAPVSPGRRSSSSFLDGVGVSCGGVSTPPCVNISDLPQTVDIKQRLPHDQAAVMTLARRIILTPFVFRDAAMVVSNSFGNNMSPSPSRYRSFRQVASEYPH